MNGLFGIDVVVNRQLFPASNKRKRADRLGGGMLANLDARRSKRSKRSEPKRNATEYTYGVLGEIGNKSPIAPRSSKELKESHSCEITQKVKDVSTSRSVFERLSSKEVRKEDVSAFEPSRKQPRTKYCMKKVPTKAPSSNRIMSIAPSTSAQQESVLAPSRGSVMEIPVRAHSGVSVLAPLRLVTESAPLSGKSLVSVHVPLLTNQTSSVLEGAPLQPSRGGFVSVLAAQAPESSKLREQRTTTKIRRGKRERIARRDRGDPVNRRRVQSTHSSDVSKPIDSLGNLSMPPDASHSITSSLVPVRITPTTHNELQRDLHQENPVALWKRRQEKEDASLIASRVMQSIQSEGFLARNDGSTLEQNSNDLKNEIHRTRSGKLCGQSMEDIMDEAVDLTRKLKKPKSLSVPMEIYFVSTKKITSEKGDQQHSGMEKSASPASSLPPQDEVRLTEKSGRKPDEVSLPEKSETEQGSCKVLEKMNHVYSTEELGSPFPINSKTKDKVISAPRTEGGKQTFVFSREERVAKQAKASTDPPGIVLEQRGIEEVNLRLQCSGDVKLKVLTPKEIRRNSIYAPHSRLARSVTMETYLPMQDIEDEHLKLHRFQVGSHAKRLSATVPQSLGTLEDTDEACRLELKENKPFQGGPSSRVIEVDVFDFEVITNLFVGRAKSENEELNSEDDQRIQKEKHQMYGRDQENRSAHTTDHLELSGSRLFTENEDRGLGRLQTENAVKEAPRKRTSITETTLDSEHSKTDKNPVAGKRRKTKGKSKALQEMKRCASKAVQRSGDTFKVHEVSKLVNQNAENLKKTDEILAAQAPRRSRRAPIPTNRYSPERVGCRQKKRGDNDEFSTKEKVAQDRISKCTEPDADASKMKSSRTSHSKKYHDNVTIDTNSTEATVAVSGGRRTMKFVQNASDIDQSCSSASVSPPKRKAKRSKEQTDKNIQPKRKLTTDRHVDQSCSTTSVSPPITTSRRSRGQTDKHTIRPKKRPRTDRDLDECSSDSISISVSPPNRKSKRTRQQNEKYTIRRKKTTTKPNVRRDLETASKCIEEPLDFATNQIPKQNPLNAVMCISIENGEAFRTKQCIVTKPTNQIMSGITLTKGYKRKDGVMVDTSQVKTMDNTESASSQVDPESWTENQLSSLRAAYSSVDPRSVQFWEQVANLIDGKREDQCKDKWFALVKTPAAKRKVAVKEAKRRVHAVRGAPYDEDDLFDATPMKTKSPYNGESYNEPTFDLDVGSPIVDDCHSRIVDENEYDDGLELAAPIARVGYKSYIKNMKRDLLKAEKGGKKKRAAATKKVCPRVLSDMIDDGYVEMNGCLTPGGTVRLKTVDWNEEDSDDLFEPDDEDRN